MLNKINSEQPPESKAYEWKQTQPSCGSADANMSSVKNIEQNRISAVKQELLNMDAPGNDTVQYDETNSNKKKKLIKVQRPNWRLQENTAARQRYVWSNWYKRRERRGHWNWTGKGY